MPTEPMNPSIDARGEDREKPFPRTRKGWQGHWKFEMDAAEKEFKRWHKEGEQVVKRYLDERPSSGSEFPRDNQTRWNIFPRNVQMQQDLVFGKVPSVTVTRKFGDPNDDVARVAGELLERVLNNELQRDSDGFNISAEYALQDYQLSGLGIIKLRYRAGMGTKKGKAAIVRNGQEVAPATRDLTVKTDEDVETDYIFWKDVRWNPSRTYYDIRWIGFKTQMSRQELVKRFGDKIGSVVPLNAQKSKKAPEVDAQKMEPWGRAEVWEIWSKEHEAVFWWVDGHTEILDLKKDFYQLQGFWPCPPPLVANTTTSKFIPVPDFRLAKDLYDEIDALSTKITAITRVLKVAGVYDASMGNDLKKLVNEAGLNELVPIRNWPAFSEKSGLKGVIDWFPFEAVIEVLDKLSEKRAELLQMCYQITGYSDLMRGEETENGTPGEAAIKTKFASMRLQAQQDRFARFISNAQKIRAELIVKFYDTKTIIQRSNALYSFDQADLQLLPQAIQLLRDKLWMYRIEVKPENVAMTDFAAQRNERVEVLTMLSQFLASAAPLAQLMPDSVPLLLQILQWSLAGLKGSTVLEGAIDRAISQATSALAAAKANPQQQPPDPKLQAAQIKGQMDLQKIAAQTQSELITQENETKQVAIRKEHETAMNVAEEQARQSIRAKMEQNTAPSTS